MSLRLSVVVPTLNEERRIGAQLDRLAAIPEVHEVIVADGGSSDRTVEIVRARPMTRLVTATGGRGPQLNAGARVATGDALLFLHADVTLPAGGASLALAALADPQVVGGAFRTKTVADGRRAWPSRWLWLADMRSRYSRVPYGDQALFVRRAVFDALGGFAPMPLFEDLEFSRRLRRAGRLAHLRASVEVSGRRFMAHPLYYTCFMNTVPVFYRLGVPPHLLARLYGHIR